jgi:hypothetical protein
MAAAAEWFPTHGAAYRYTTGERHHDATTTVTRSEPFGKHVKRLIVLVKNGCDKRHSWAVSALAVGKMPRSLQNDEAPRVIFPRSTSKLRA